MIVQWVIDWLRDVVVLWIKGWPDPPEVLWNLRDLVVGAGTVLNQYGSAFGVVVPWNAFGQMVSWWVSIVTFWLVVLGIRAVLWAFNR